MVDKIFGRARAPRQAAPTTATRMLAWEDLPSKGIYFHRNYLRRLWEEGRFPKPVYLSQRKLAWPEAVIDEWINNKVELANYEVGSTKSPLHHRKTKPSIELNAQSSARDRVSPKKMRPGGGKPPGQ
jgi:predicted DNA-binding transcriptional regulator AlpA